MYAKVNAFALVDFNVNWHSLQNYSRKIFTDGAATTLTPRPFENLNEI